MRLAVKAVTRSRKPRIEGPLDDGSYRVHISAPPADGAANQAICEALAKHFRVPKSRIRIVQGQTSSRKVIELPDS